MKSLIYVIFAFCLINFNTYANKVLSFDASKIINYNNSISNELIDEESIVLYNLNTISGKINSFSLNINSSEALFNSEFTEFTISNFPVSPLLKDTILLKRTNSVFDGNTKFYLGNLNNKSLRKPPTIYTFEGTIKGQENSKIVLTFSKGLLFGIIQDSLKNQYSISSSINDNHTIDNLHYIYSNNIDNEGFKCYNNDKKLISTEMEDINSKAKTVFSKSNSKLLEVPIIVEGDYSYYQLIGLDYDKAIIYLTAIINNTSKIYEEYLNCRFYMQELVIRENLSNDPYKDFPSMYDKILNMSAVWKFISPGRASVLLFTKLTSSTGGLSFGGDPYIGSLCSDSEGYSVIGLKGNVNFPYLNFSWDVVCTAHEIGHSFSAPHTHNCYYEPNMIDTCVTQSTVYDACLSGSPIPREGTIMSYCHLTNKTHSTELLIHPRQVNMMRQAAESSNCIKEITKPIIELLNPLGDKIYLANSNQEIRWTSNKITNINIYVSYDNGQKWEIIKSNIPSSDSIYNWTLPNFTYTLAQIRITDASNEQIADTSEMNFTIANKSIKILTPSISIKNAIKESINITWSAYFIKNFNVSYSSDFGNSWNDLITDTTALSIIWEKTPGAGKYLIKISSFEDSSKFAISNIIEIDNPKVTIIEPKGGEEFCNDTTISVRWKSDFINDIYLQYSIDSGLTWKNVFFNKLNANLNIYTWKLPKYNSNKVFIRACAAYDKAEILDIIKIPFSILPCINGITESNLIKGLTIESLIPNPIESNAKLKISNNNNYDLSIKVNIINELGEIVKYFGTFYIKSINYLDLNLEVNDLSSGNYHILLNSNNGFFIYPFKIYK